MKYRSFDSGILLCFQDFVFYILLLHRSYFIELILNFSGRSRCQETYDYVYCKTKKKCRKQFVNTKCTAHRTDQEFPYKYHNAAADHSAESTLECGAFPEQCQQNKRSKGSTKACPCKGYDLENLAVRVTCDKYTDQCDNKNGDTCDQHTGLFAHVFHKYFFQNVLRSTGRSSEQLRVRS